MKRSLVFSLFFCLAFPCAAIPWIAIFGSTECEDCARVKREWKESYEMPAGPVLIFLPIEHAPNYAYLQKLEKELPSARKGASFPIFLVDNQFVTDIETFEEKWEGFVDAAFAAPERPETAILSEAARKAKSVLATFQIPENQAAPQANARPSEAKLAFFEQKNCAKCSRQELELELLAKSIPTLELKRFDVMTPEGMAMLTRFRKAWKLQENQGNLAPMVCWRDGYISQRLAEASELKEKLARPQSRECFWDAPLSQEEIAQEILRDTQALTFSILPYVIGGGLLDGLNPCAFATMIFLVSYLLMHKRKKRDIALVGGAFCIGVFLAYLLLGLGLSFLIDFLRQFQWMKTMIYGGCGLLATCLALGHAWDAWKYKRTGKAGDMSLGLSKDTHRGIHEKIRKYAEVKSLFMIPAAVLLGMVVSSMELACTGQVYFPMLAAILANGWNLRALALLLLYNVCFIVPLAIVAALAFRGVEAQKLADWARRNLVKTKLLMALLFAAIAFFMFYLVCPPRSRQPSPQNQTNASSLPADAAPAGK